LDEKTYEWDELERVVDQWRALELQANKINNSLPEEYKDAFFELVLHPVKAFTNLHELYLNVALNHANAKDSVLSANDYANYAKQLYQNDSLISVQYHQIANGKWNHMMDQTHIGYTYWQQPPVNKLPTLIYLKEGQSRDTSLLRRDNESAKSLIPGNALENIFYERGQFISIRADHWTRAFNLKNIKWKIIPDIGKDGDGITTFPVTASTQLNNSSPHVEYDFYTYSKDSLKLLTYFSPTLNFQNSPNGLQFAVSIDNERPQIVSLNKEDNTGVWNTWVANSIIIKTTKHFISQSGKHTVKYWVIDPGIILQKLVVDFGGLKASFLGPQETLFKSKNN
jgi:hypothetical protein